MQTLLNGLLAAGVLAASVTAAEPPNILFVLTDDQRWDAAGSASNGAVCSPGMDQRTLTLPPFL